METTKERTIRYLKDAHAAESAVGDLLDNLATSDAAPGDVALLCQDAVRDQRNRLGVLEARLKSLDSNPSPLKEFANSAMGLFAHLANIAHDSQDKVTMDLIKAHAAGHLLHASYVALGSFAFYVNDTETRTIADKYKEETHAMANSLLPGIDEAARSVPFTHAEPAVPTP